jgi:hypothetical protein
MVVLLTVLGAANALLVLFTPWAWPQVVDGVLVWLFLGEILLRVVGVGPFRFFSERWNIVDSAMVVTSVGCFFVSSSHRALNLVRLFRFLRLAGAVRIVLLSPCLQELQNPILYNIKRVFTTFVEIMPIIVKFFHLFAFLYFVLGILGMEIFYSTEQQPNPHETYNTFDQFSNFETFLHSQYLMMQILTEGSWAVNAWSYCSREPQAYGWIVALFILMHVLIVTLLANLLKGICWEVYFTVSSMLDLIEDQQREHKVKQRLGAQALQEISQINSLIVQHESVEPDTIIKREIIEKKLDVEIIKRIKDFEFYEEKPLESMRSQNRSKIVSKLMEHHNITPQELSSYRRQPSANRGPKRKKTLNVLIADEPEEVGLHEEMEEFLSRLVISSRLKFSEIVAYPRPFVGFLNSKFRQPGDYARGEKFDLNVNPLSNSESMNFHMYSMNGVMGLETTTRETKSVVVNSLLSSKLISDQTAGEILKSKHMLRSFHIDTDGAVRKMYLAETNEFLVKKFEIEYFADVYGNSFRQINKITLEPLLKFEASLTYALWNLLRYEQIDSHDFFHLLTHVEDQMSNKLLKPGSLVKFVYKLDHESDIWFMIEQKTGQDLQVRFIKTGLWCETADLEANTPYCAKDVFNWSTQETAAQSEGKDYQRYMKLFFESFESLAFSLINKRHFFESNPREHIYDLYLYNYDASRRLRKASFGQLRICNIMLVVLSKEDQRIDVGLPNLDYPMSEIRSEPQKRKEEDFILDD